jgi:hypothetical protein
MKNELFSLKVSGQFSGRRLFIGLSNSNRAVLRKDVSLRLGQQDRVKNGP